MGDLENNLVEEFKDKRGDIRIRVTAKNGNIIYSSTEGYKNKSECIKAAVRASKALLAKYEPLNNNDHEQV